MIEHAVYEDAMRRILELAGAVSPDRKGSPVLQLATFLASNGSLQWQVQCARVVADATTQIKALKELEELLRWKAETLAKKHLDARCEPARRALKETALPSDYWQRIETEGDDG